MRKWSDRTSGRIEAIFGQLVVLPNDSVLAQKWAEVTAHRRRIGRPIDCGDAWIAATALRYEATLMSHNRRHFDDIPGLAIISHPA